MQCRTSEQELTSRQPFFFFLNWLKFSQAFDIDFIMSSG